LTWIHQIPNVLSAIQGVHLPESLFSIRQVAFGQVAHVFAEGLSKKEIVVEKKKVRIDIEKTKCGKAPIYGLKC
jgi:hypothetical protein